MFINLYANVAQFLSPWDLIFFKFTCTQETPDYLRGLIKKTRTLTDKPFGVAVVLAFPHEENIKAILAEKVAVLQVSWGDVREELVHEAHCAGVKVVPQVSALYTDIKNRNRYYDTMLNY